jgi:Ca2+-binding RTX toxin-like protein
MSAFRAGATGVDFDLLDLAPLGAVSPTGATPTSAELRVGPITAQMFGAGFAFAAAGPPTAGVIERLVVALDGALAYDITGLALSASPFRAAVLAGDNATAKALIFAGDDAIGGSDLADRLRAYAGADTLQGAGGSDVLDGGDGDDDVFGGQGADTITDAGGANYLRGDEGDDYVVGGAGFDDINGNMGADTADGGFGDDWVVGGKDNDLLYGDAGNDLVYGNLGDDTTDGGAGADTLRGGQGSDSVAGGAGADFISGDRGEDTVSGGTGADLFHAFSEAGLDRVLDFRASEGDRVQLDPGTTYTLTQVGADTVITMSGGQVVLVGVSLSSLGAGSVFLA